MKYLVGIALLCAWATAFGTDPVRMAPQISGVTPDGTRLSLEGMRGRVVLVDFWASWCAPCAVALPEYVKIQGKFPEQNFVVIAVNVDKDDQRGKVLRMVDRIGLTFPVVLDSTHAWAESFSPPTMPSSYLIDRQGRVVQVFEGFRAGDEVELEAAIRRQIEGAGA